MTRVASIVWRGVGVFDTSLTKSFICIFYDGPKRTTHLHEKSAHPPPQRSRDRHETNGTATWKHFGIPSVKVSLYRAVPRVCHSVTTGFYLFCFFFRVLLGVYWILLCLTGFYWVLLGRTVFHCFFLVFTGFHWVLLV